MFARLLSCIQQHHYVPIFFIGIPRQRPSMDWVLGDANFEIPATTFHIQDDRLCISDYIMKFLLSLNCYMVNVEPSDRGHSGKRMTDLVRKAIEVILAKPEAPVLLDLADTLAPRPLPRSWTLLLLALADLREPVASFRYPLSRGLSQQTVGFSRTIFGIRCRSTFRHPSQTR